VIIAYPLGKSQEVIRHLDSAGFRVRAHHSVWENCRIYGEFGVPLSKVRKLRDGARRGEVVVAPHSAKRTKILQNLKSPHLVAVTGWAVDQGAEYRMGVDEALPLSDHADFPALVEYARASGAEKVFVVHGSTVEFVHALREAGIDAEPLVKPRQMELF
jgi:putative mRNA 3-end processing factor